MIIADRVGQSNPPRAGPSRVNSRLLRLARASPRNSGVEPRRFGIVIVAVLSRPRRQTDHSD